MDVNCTYTAECERPAERRCCHDKSDYHYTSPALSVRQKDTYTYTHTYTHTIYWLKRKLQYASDRNPRIKCYLVSPLLSCPGSGGKNLTINLKKRSLVSDRDKQKEQNRKKVLSCAVKHGLASACNMMILIPEYFLLSLALVPKMFCDLHLICLASGFSSSNHTCNRNPVWRHRNETVLTVCVHHFLT